MVTLPTLPEKKEVVSYTCSACNGTVRMRPLMKKTGYAGFCEDCYGLTIHLENKPEPSTDWDCSIGPDLTLPLGTQAPFERYFDITDLKTFRVHGWYCPATRQVVQYG